MVFMGLGEFNPHAVQESRYFHGYYIMNDETIT